MGFSADAEHKVKATAVLFSIAGFTFNLLLLGLSEETLCCLIACVFQRLCTRGRTHALMRVAHVSAACFH